MHRRRWGAVPAALALTVAAACSDDDSGADADPIGDEPESIEETVAAVEPEAYEGDDFYEVPDPLPDAEPGTLLRYEPIDDYDVAGAAAWRIMYLSESLPGDPIVVTGTALVPSEPPPDDGRKLLTISHGTTGSADECAPSRDPLVTEATLTGPFIESDYVVVMSDYEGQSTPGRHPYLVGESEGRSVLDAAKAAHDLPDAAIGDRYAIIGYSQGGHGALWAHQLADEWGPDMELVGSVAGAPATELPTVFAVGEAMAGFFLSMVAGYEAAYPEADPALILTEAGLEAMEAVDEGCVRHVFAAAADVDEPLVQEGHTNVEPWVTLMEENDPGRVATDDPVLILHSSADDIVPANLSERLLERMCDVGQTVERRTYEEGQGHGAAAPTAYADGYDWIEAMMDGDTPLTTCE